MSTNVYDTPNPDSKFKSPKGRYIMSILNHRSTIHASGSIKRLLFGSKIGYFFSGVSSFVSALFSRDASWSISACILVKKEDTATANQRPPPSWKDPRWPPQLVVQSKAYGFCLNSSKGMAALEEI